MNSGLQCMQNTFALTSYFLNTFSDQDINRDNPLGTKGNLVTEFARLVKEMWLESAPSVSPWSFKRAIGFFASQFSGYN
jgi:ubiquitin carboxyl-terminal hydrolase 4/11/15